jgi:hypothetical protein
VIAALLYAMVGAQLLDTLSFVRMVGILGPAAEGNPLVTAAYGLFGIGGAIFGKASVTLMAASVVLIGRSRIRIVLAVALAAVLVGSYGAWTNIQTLAMNGGSTSWGI